MSVKPVVHAVPGLRRWRSLGLAVAAGGALGCVLPMSAAVAADVSQAAPAAAASASARPASAADAGAGGSADASGDSAGADGGGISEVIVTSRNREESSQDVPIPISVI